MCNGHPCPFHSQAPEPEDIFWLIEVSKTSLKKDLEIKALIYATANIREYWVLNLSANELIVMQNPQNGEYTSETIIRQGVITPLAFPNINVLVSKLF